MQEKPPDENTYLVRADECRELAKIAPKHLQENYLRMAAYYEQLAKERQEPP
jgi:hypothetical protein